MIVDLLLLVCIMILTSTVKRLENEIRSVRKAVKTYESR